MALTKIAAPLVLLSLCLARPAHALLLCDGVLGGPVTVSASDLSFGSYMPASPSYASVTVTVRCSALGVDLLPSFTVSLLSANSADPSARFMAYGGNHLGYNIYTSAGYATVWGDGTSGSSSQSYASLLALGSISYTAWGRLPAGQYVRAGSYGDQITVVVSY